MLKALIWLIGFSGLPLGIFLALQVYWIINSGFLGVVTFFGTLAGMALLAGKIDKRFKINFFNDEIVQRESSQ